ncbi:MAG: HAD family hydrolase [Anaerolineales bacterium]|jgi:phosphoglycolate phosphatase-like HAD superfamily hydrolase
MSLALQRIRALCFDVDGTLSDTDDVYTQKVARFFPPFLFRNPERAARRFVMWVESPGNALIGLPDIVGLDDEILGLWEWLNRHRPRPMKHFMMVPGIKAMLERLYGKYPMAVVSARDDKSTREFLNQFELTGYFQEIVTAITAEHTKPYPDPILYAAEKMNVAPENCLMIGDTTVDIRAGKTAGAQTVGVLCGFGERAELERRQTDLILENTSDLADVLLQS